MSFFHDFFARFTSVVKSIVAFILPVAESASGQILAAMLPVAEGIVANLDKGSLSSPDKRAAAEKALADAAKKAGYAAASSTLNLALEMAVNKLRSGPSN